MASVAELLQDVGAGAGGLTFIWTVATYGVVVGVKAEPEFRDQPGIRIVVKNRSPQRSVRVEDVEALHWEGLLKRRAGERAGPFLSAPSNPWEVGPDKTESGWIPLSAVDGSKGGSRPAVWDFSKAVKVRVRLAGHRARTSRRFSATHSRSTERG
jgi:hypothetical protein